MIDIYAILEKYKPNEDLFSDEDEYMTKLKKVIYEDLDTVDRYVILMYAECASLRALGKEIGISASAASQKINQIRRKIYDKLTADN